MATMARSIRSTLNPNAPPFIPAAFQVEDFSPEWWNLIKTSTWFHEYWLCQQEDREIANDDFADEDVADLLPDSFDLGFEDVMANLDRFDKEPAQQAFVPSDASMKNKLKTDIAVMLTNGKIKSPKGYQPAKYWEKPVQVVSPKYSPRHIIQQPR